MTAPADPPAVPPVWWSPTHGVIQASATGISYSILAGCKAINGLPPDAVEWPFPSAGAVPDTPGRCGDTGELLFGKTFCCELRAGHAGWHREGVTEWSGVVARRAAGAVPDTGHEFGPTSRCVCTHAVVQHDANWVCQSWAANADGSADMHRPCPCMRFASASPSGDTGQEARDA